MANNIKVVLFEDTEQTRSEVLRALRDELSTEGSVVPFEPDRLEETPAESEGTYEDRLEAILNKPPYDNTTLVVADRDLSKSERFGGLSVNSVAAAARRLAIPVCAYARAFKSDDDFTWRARWEEGLIVLSLSKGESELARKAAVAARGFVEIAERLPFVDVDANNSPAKLLAALLGKPEFSSKIALYAVGDQNRLTELPREGQQREDWEKRATHFLGYWLSDSLLRYPGVFVSEVAAASHLNIKTESYLREEVKALFAEALYDGPFADAQSPQWWRGLLDDIVVAENCADGLEMVQRKVDANIGRSECSVDPTKSAGYYCIISALPVSLENSRGNLSWFPRGADLTRVNKLIFDEYGPWLGT
jgi:hypothetical protein